MEWLDIGELANAVLLEPGEERTDRPVIGHARMIVLDRSGEEFEEPAGCTVTGFGDHCRHGQRAVECRRRDRRRDLDHRRHVAAIAAHADTL
jgi:hypothetical protein